MKKISFKKKEKQPKEKKLKVIKVGTHKKSVMFLWVLLIGSLSFGIYKNFTAIDIHTINETKVVEQRIVDTSKIQSFVSNFVNSYYKWEHSQSSLDSRNEALKQYMTEELQILNSDTIRIDIPTTSSVQRVQFWNIKQVDQSNYEVLYTVNQLITESENKKTVQSSYTVNVYVDEYENLVITNNPTVSIKPVKSSYNPEVAITDNTVDASTTEEINDFLKTFFTLYPKANEKELTYYVSNNALKPVNKNYVFVELVNPVYKMVDEQVQVSISIKYLDEETKATQISQFNLTLQKADNWIIVR